jgi:GT2 family glycosyltransferase
MTQDIPDTTIMMVTYNRLDLTIKTMKGLLTKDPGRDYNLVIVDNGSNDGTVDFLDTIAESGRIKKVVIVKLPENKGIAVGRNIALKTADDLKTKWFCTIDNDVEMPDGWLQECIEILEANKGFGIIGVNMENTLYPIVQRSGYTFQEKPQGNLGTACMVFRKQVHQMIGFFTTEYGKYGEEDADFGMRTRVAGFRMGYIERMGTHLGADESEVGEYRTFKTKQHADNLALFKQNCARYSQKTKALFIPYKD